ncbi:MAG: hypothetical protein WKF84_18750 [Pyrinomonadaceae bacterium]
MLEQFKYKDGAEAFRRSLAIDPKLTLARINLGIALCNVPELDEALLEIRSWPPSSRPTLRSLII